MADIIIAKNKRMRIEGFMSKKIRGLDFKEMMREVRDIVTLLTSCQFNATSLQSRTRGLP
jgi:hypothetical protein